jgi:diadenosine tetraphosphate (Ap4A) HIT family hydrolase
MDGLAAKRQFLPGMSVSLYQRLEHGMRSGVASATLARLAVALSVSADFLLGLDHTSTRGQEPDRGGRAMSDTGCALCMMLEGLRHADIYQHPTSGEGFRKIHELPTAIAALTHDQYYPGYTLVVAITHATELYHLPESESIAYYTDMLRVAKAIATVFQPQKMNYELLGNTVAYLHWHLVPRYSWDPQPQRPIWEHAHEPKVLSPHEYAETITAIRQALV